ncbi:PAS domain S-box protein [Gloeocapsopsis dulcis]|uniref:histidine kinase n=1 Tax=Gloeocapsopsis dulcis AAB1 = 1H9 TaxID=1433147 RepID=A0A6N8FZS9_9CHRO|nr:PAS domain S-box protein [Gloeocapsopsis dulcis]MUL38593.1 hypothetical protein [Gloeocapsopsis dulcis AAB1 = 1H9]WNN91153.1 PAS domain S-box protein [Gloeocapsopsis dulcis]
MSFPPSQKTIASTEEITQIDTHNNHDCVITNFQPATIKILLIEDNSGDARLVRKLLAEATISKCRLTHVERLSEALQHLKEDNFDVILLDLSLPGGHELDNVIQLHAIAPNVPLVVLTGFDDEALAIRSVREGAQDYLVKGYMDSNLLVRAIRHAIERHQLLANLEQRTQELQARETNFRNVIATNMDGMIIIDSYGVVRFVNPATEALFNCKAEELLNKSFGFPVMAGETRDFCIIRQGRESAVVEMRVTETSWEGECAYLASIRDITEQKRAEESFRLNERAMAAASNGIVIVDPRQPDSPIIYCNPAFERMTGYSQDEVLGYNCRFLQGPDTDPTALAEIRCALHEERECRVILKNYRKDGTPFWNELAIAPVQDANGQLTHFIGVQSDITERKRAEEAVLRAKVAEAAKLALETEITERKQVEIALRESEERYRSVVDNVKEVIFQTNTAGIWTFLNPAWQDITGFTVEASIGKYFANYIHPSDRQHQIDLFQSLITEQQECYRQEVRYLNHNGSFRWIEVYARLTQDSEGNVIGTSGTLNDITKRKRAEEDIRSALEKAKELNELKSRFITITSHEFRTPLATILSSTELVRKYSHKLSEEKKLLHLERIQIAVKNMTQLLDDVLLIGKAEAGKLDFNPKPLALTQFCRDLVEEMQLTAGSQHAIAFVNQNCDTHIFCMDEKLLRHILGNLLSNAIKYSPAGGTILLELIYQQEAVIFHVRDEGIGIPEADQAKLFDLFHRASNVGTISGTGLGLAIVKKAVDFHGGKITIASKIGIGTTFTVKFPLNDRIKTND